MPAVKAVRLGDGAGTLDRPYHVVFLPGAALPSRLNDTARKGIFGMVYNYLLTPAPT